MNYAPFADDDPMLPATPQPPMTSRDWVLIALVWLGVVGACSL